MNHHSSASSIYLSTDPSHPLAARKFVTVKDIENDKFIIFPRKSAPASYDDVVSIFQSRGKAFNIVQEATEQFTIAGLVAAGIGISIVPAAMSLAPVPGIKHIPLKGIKNRTSFAVITRRDPDMAVQNFMKLL